MPSMLWRIIQQQTRIAFSLLTCAETSQTNSFHCNEIHSTNDIGPTIVSFSGVLDQDQGCMPSTLFEDEQCIERVCQLFDVEYLIPAVTVTNKIVLQYLCWQ